MKKINIKKLIAAVLMTVCTFSVSHYLQVFVNPPLLYAVYISSEDKIVSYLKKRYGNNVVLKSEIVSDESILKNSTPEEIHWMATASSALQTAIEIISLETGKSITKSGLNHRMWKIKELAMRLKKETK